MHPQKSHTEVAGKQRLGFHCKRNAASQFTWIDFSELPRLRKC